MTYVKNPALHLKCPRIKEKPRETFTWEEVRKILAFAVTYEPQRTALGIMTMLLTGLRRGELLGLKDSDITDTTLTVNRAVYLERHQARVIEHEAKTEKSLRTVPLLPELAYRLQHLSHKGEFLFGTKTERCCTHGILPAIMTSSFVTCGKQNRTCGVCLRIAAATPLAHLRAKLAQIFALCKSFLDTPTLKLRRDILTFTSVK